MNQYRAQRLRFGILAARHALERHRLTEDQTDFIEGCEAVGWAIKYSAKAFDRECVKAWLRSYRATRFVPGDLVRISVSDQACKEFDGRQGVITHGPDDSYNPGWLVSAAGGGLRCVAAELTMITPRERR